VEQSEFDRHQAETAAELGYATVDAMNAEHDPIHKALCKALGFTESPTLAAVENSEPLDHDWVRCEEAMVLAAQRFLNEYRRAHPS